MTEFQGGCLCGAVRYRVSGPPRDPTNCHCATCRKAHAAAFVSWATFDASELSFGAGQPTRYASSPNVTRSFCGSCGTPLTYQRRDLPGEIDVSICSLDAPDELPPRTHIWTRHKLGWLALQDGLPAHERFRSETSALSATHDHPIRGRFHAWFLSATEEGMHRLYGARKRKLFASLPGSIVEVGAGTGANCRYYESGTSLIAVEPNLRMHERLAANAQHRGVDVEIRGLKGERLDLPSQSADAVVCTLVLCSVDNPAAVVSEIMRVLKPGGRYVFLEHVAAPAGTALRTLQNALQRPWTWWFEGCRPNRETESTLREAGFSALEIDHFRVRSPFVHCAPQIAGVATR